MFALLLCMNVALTVVSAVVDPNIEFLACCKSKPDILESYHEWCSYSHHIIFWDMGEDPNKVNI